MSLAIRLNAFILGMRAFREMIFLKMFGLDVSFGGSTTGGITCAEPTSGSPTALVPPASVPILLFNEKTLINELFIREASEAPPGFAGVDSLGSASVSDDEDDDDNEHEPTSCWPGPGTCPCPGPPMPLSSRGAALEIMLREDAECDFSKDTP